MKCKSSCARAPFFISHALYFITIVRGRKKNAKMINMILFLHFFLFVTRLIVPAEQFFFLLSLSLEIVSTNCKSAAQKKCFRNVGTISGFRAHGCAVFSHIGRKKTERFCVNKHVDDVKMKIYVQYLAFQQHSSRK